MPIDFRAIASRLGLLSTRPSATTVGEGSLFLASDTGQVFRSDEQTWTEFVVSSGAAVSVMSFGAIGNGIADDRAAIQAAFDAAASGEVVLFPPGKTFLWTGTITLTKDVCIYAYGATLKRSGAGTTTGFVNTSPINLQWYGGIIDGNNINGTQSLLSLGASGVTPSSTSLLSCTARDIQWINVGHGAWTCNNVSNTDIVWDNLQAYKAGTGDSGDVFEISGTNIKCHVSGDNNSTHAFFITSAYLVDSEITSFVPNSLIASWENILLETYVGNGALPNLKNVTLEGNGQILLANATIIGGTVAVSDSIRIICRDAGAVTIGNDDIGAWVNTKIEGTLRPVLGGGLIIHNAHSLEVDLLIDCSHLGAAGVAGVITLAGATSNYLRFSRLVVRQLGVAGAATVFSSPAASTTELSILSGDIAELSQPLFNNAELAHYGTLVVKNVLGYNPRGHAVTQPAIPSSGTGFFNTTGVDCMVVVVGGTVSAISVGGSATGLTSGTFRVPAGQNITLTYTVAPTWQWFGD